jgi:DNA-binding FrmR family transcriptional regulator
MAHLSKNSDALVMRVRRLIGQLQAVERALVAEEDCTKTLHLVAGIRGAISGLTDELIEAHLRTHVADPDLAPDVRAAGTEALIAAIRRYAK